MFSTYLCAFTKCGSPIALSLCFLFSKILCHHFDVLHMDVQNNIYVYHPFIVISINTALPTFKFIKHFCPLSYQFEGCYRVSDICSISDIFEICFISERHFDHLFLVVTIWNIQMPAGIHNRISTNSSKCTFEKINHCSKAYS